MQTLYVKLAQRQLKFVRRSVETGRYQNASEVVRAGLRLLEQQEAEDKARLKVLRRVAMDAFDALDEGRYTTFTPETLDQFFDGVDRRIRRA